MHLKGTLIEFAYQKVVLNQRVLETQALNAVFVVCDLICRKM